MQRRLALFESEITVELLKQGIVGKRDKSFIAFPGHPVNESVDGEIAHTLISESGRYGKGSEFNRFGINMELFHTTHNNTIDLRYIKSGHVLENILKVCAV